MRSAWCCRSMLTVAAMMATVVLSLTTSTAAQSSSNTSCAQNLIPCASYINTTTTPPDSCCTPIKQTVETQLTCLCNLYNTPGLLESLGVTVSQALDLSRRCGITQGLSACNTTNAPSPSGSTTPPATPGGDNGAGRVTFTGLSFLLLFWVSMLFN